MNELLINGCGKSIIQQMRNINDEQQFLVKRATKECEMLSDENLELKDICEKQLTVNENLIELFAKLFAKQEIDEENKYQDILKANSELFEETQRLTDEHECWIEEKKDLNCKISSLKLELSECQNHLGNEQLEKDLLNEQLQTERDNHQEECKNLIDLNGQLETKLNNLQFIKERENGEKLKLMLDIEEQERYFKKEKECLRNQLKENRNQLLKLEQENLSLSYLKADKSFKEENKFKELIEKNRNLSDWHQQLVDKNTLLQNENLKLKKKCDQLEEILSQEGRDIGDALKAIKNGKEFNKSPKYQKNSMFDPFSNFRERYI